MEYTVQKLAKMAGVSPRTLRYYDEIGLLKPKRLSSSGYRIYGREEVELLQQILFYRELGIGLENIREIVLDPAFDSMKALKEHHHQLILKKKQLELLIANVEKTMETEEGRDIMKDQERFEGFKEKLLRDNEQKYGKEIREKYGDEVINASNKKVSKMIEVQFEEVTKLAEDILETLKEAYKTGDSAGETAQKAADLHRQWLSYYWPSYSKEAHACLAQMYVADERFTAYYDQEHPGLAAFLRDAILVYTEMAER